MNALCYKIVFSKRLGTLVAVGEHTTGRGKTASGTGTRSTVTHHGIASTLKTSALVIALSWLTHSAYAAGPAANALPTDANINSGKVAISTQGAAMTIQQTSNKASVNWNSFNIGSAAAVNINQPSANSVLLNRVVGNDPSQIFGKLTANGQVVLINPNGLVFGQGGSVTASAFTASTFGLSDDDFAKGKYNYTRNGSTAGVTVQNGSSLNATAPGGYVALISASVNNEGTISTKQGSVVMAAGESAVLPAALTDNVSVPLSGKVRLELSPSTINASAANSGAITTEGGQVLMQAAAISDAVASISHSGSINTTGAQGGAVTLQADGGIIQAHGSIKANSTDANRVGGDIIIGRDTDTGMLAKATDVSGAKLESKGGFVETSGSTLQATNVGVKAGQWLLDPYDIEITDASSLTAGYTSKVSASALGAALTSGTTVTVSTSSGTTSNVPSTLVTGGNGDILVSSAILASGTSTLNLIADRSIILKNNISAYTSLNLGLTATTGSISGTGNITLNNGNLNLSNATDGTLSGIIKTHNGLSTTWGNITTKTGAGRIAFTGGNGYFGVLNINQGTLAISNESYITGTTIQQIWKANIGQNGTLEYFAKAGSTFDVGPGGTQLEYYGLGRILKTGSGTLQWGGGKGLFSMSQGGLIDIQAGTFIGGIGTTNEDWIGNKSSLNIGAGATFQTNVGAVTVDALTGDGSLQVGSAGITLGIGASSGLFNGIISNGSGAVGNVTKVGTGTQIFSKDNTYTGVTNVNGGTLQIGNAGTTGKLGAGAVTLANNANLSFVSSGNTTISNVITGTGNVSANITTSTGNASNLTINSSNFSLTNGTINLRADGDIFLNTPITTTNATGDAVKLVAGQALDAGDSSGGNIKITGTGAVTVGSGGVAALYSGSIDYTTGTSSMAASSSGKFRYNSDETTTNFSTTNAPLLGKGLVNNNGVNIIYREAPTIQLTAKDTLTGLIYDGTTKTGSQGVTDTTSQGTLKNGDKDALLTGDLKYAYYVNGISANPKNAGTYTVTASGQTSALGYKVKYVDGRLIIGQKEVGLTAVKTYDGSKNLTDTELTIITGVNNETLGYSSATINSKDVKDNNSNFVDTVTLTDGTGKASNYKFTATHSANNTAMVSAKRLTGSINDITTTYGTAAQAGSVVLTGVIGNDVVTSTASIVDAANSSSGNLKAGSYKQTATAITGADADNYSFSGVTTANNNYTVNKKAITLSGITANNKTYDGSTHATVSTSNAVFNDQIAGDNLFVLSSGFFIDKNATSGKSVLLKNTIDGSDSSNYMVTDQTSTTANINKKSIILSGITAANKTYDGSIYAAISNVEFLGLVSNEFLNASATGTFDSKNAGTRTATVSTNSVSLSDDSASGGLVSNYNLIAGSKSNTAIINKAPLYLSASIDTKIYDNTTTSNATVKVSGLVVGDSANATQDFSSKNAMGSGGSTLHVNSDYVVNDGNGGNNYSVKLIDASGTIAPKVLILIYSEISKKMDGTTQATVEATPSNFGVIGADDVTIAQTATYDTPTAGTGKTVTVRNITLSGKDSANYTLKTSHTTTKGTIVAVPPIAVPPVVMPTKTSSDVSNSGASGHANARIAIGDINPFQLATVPSAIEDVCSSSNLEKCRCEDSPLDTSISFCYEPK